MKLRDKRIKLDWGKLLGFSQVKIAQRNLKSQVARALIGVKVGQKFGLKYVA